MTKKLICLCFIILLVTWYTFRLGLWRKNVEVSHPRFDVRGWTLRLTVNIPLTDQKPLSQGLLDSTGDFIEEMENI